MGKIEPAATAHHRLRQTAELEGHLIDRADVIALTGDLSGQRFTVEDRLVLGREEGADIWIQGDEVSRRHAAIARTSAAEFVLEDLDSRNGTLVNGVPIKVHVLKFGDKLQVGSRALFVFAPHSTLEEQLIRWQRIEVIGQMAAGVVHDFANYITAVLGQVDYLRKRLHGPGLDERVLARSLDEIQIAATQGFKLTRKVLDFARSAESAGHPLDLTAVIEDALRLTARGCDAQIDVNCTVEPELVITGDRTELLQVLINLLLNARDAMPQGGELNVSARVVQDGEEIAHRVGTESQVRIEVTDTGVGMDEHTRARVFEPLFTTKAAGSGTGLGLSTVARIIETHHGVVDVQSQPGCGTTIRIWLRCPQRRNRVGSDTVEQI